VARYAWGRDYHRVLKKRLQRLLKRCAERFDEETLRWRIFTDAVPLLERALARSAGLGFVGKNTMLIRPGVGSYTFIGELLWNVEIEPTQSLKQFSSDAGCGSCSRCLNVCPTGALPRPGRLDARRCISYLTIEKKTAFEDWERKALGEWVFGCDLCQEVCPYNHSAVALPKIEEFSAKAGVGPILNLQELLSVRTREGFLQRFKGTPLMRAGREALLRNACCVLGNTKAFQAIENLRALAKEDSSGLVRYHAAACLDELLDDSDGLDRLRIASATRKRADQPQ
jgi:epoxyqueuosine reductase